MEEYIKNMEKASRDLKAINKRIHQRYNVHYLADVYLGAEILFATVVDISETGADIILPRKFYMNEILNLRISCNLINKERSELEKVNIYLRAEIVWIKEIESMYKAGLKIIDIAYEDTVKLRDHLRYLKERMLWEENL